MLGVLAADAATECSQGCSERSEQTPGNVISPNAQALEGRQKNRASGGCRPIRGSTSLDAADQGFAHFVRCTPGYTRSPHPRLQTSNPQTRTPQTAKQFGVFRLNRRVDITKVRLVGQPAIRSARNAAVKPAGPQYPGNNYYSQDHLLSTRPRVERPLTRGISLGLRPSRLGRTTRQNHTPQKCPREAVRPKSFQFRGSAEKFTRITPGMSKTRKVTRRFPL